MSFLKAKICLVVCFSNIEKEKNNYLQKAVGSGQSPKKLYWLHLTATLFCCFYEYGLPKLYLFLMIWLNQSVLSGQYMAFQIHSICSVLYRRWNLDMPVNVSIVECKIFISFICVRSNHLWNRYYDNIFTKSF